MYIDVLRWINNYRVLILVYLALSQILIQQKLLTIIYVFIGSAKMAIQVLAKVNVRPENIMFLNLICAPEGLKALTDEYPQVQVVTGAIDDCLDENRFIVPGLGDYGDRYYGTEGSI